MTQDLNNVAHEPDFSFYFVIYKRAIQVSEWAFGACESCLCLLLCNLPKSMKQMKTSHLPFGACPTLFRLLFWNFSASNVGMQRWPKISSVLHKHQMPVFYPAIAKIQRIFFCVFYFEIWCQNISKVKKPYCVAREADLSCNSTFTDKNPRCLDDVWSTFSRFRPEIFILTSEWKKMQAAKWHCLCFVVHVLHFWSFMLNLMTGSFNIQKVIQEMHCVAKLTSSSLFKVD